MTLDYPNRPQIVWVNERINWWRTAIDNRSYRRAAKVAIEGIRELCQSSGCQAQLRFDLRVLLNGLRDLANLCAITAHIGWCDNTKAVEKAWRFAHDALARIERYHGIEEEFPDYCLEMIRPFFETVKKRFGHGIYTSWEVLYDGLICTICELDTRECAHVAGRWYGDRLCQNMAKHTNMTGVAIVDNPRDPRCRIWPWQRVKDEYVYEHVPIYIEFAIEGEEDGGSSVNVAELFRKTLGVQ